MNQENRSSTSRKSGKTSNKSAKTDSKSTARTPSRSTSKGKNSSPGRRNRNSSQEGRSNNRQSGQNSGNKNSGNSRKRRNRGQRGTNQRKNTIEKPVDLREIDRISLKSISTQPSKPVAKKTYAVSFYDSIAEVHRDLDHIQEIADSVDQLNIITKSDADMDDPQVVSNPKIKLYAGAAWYLIHKRREDDGWYEVPQE